jgi:hypothetical protein
LQPQRECDRIGGMGEYEQKRVDRRSRFPAHPRTGQDFRAPVVVRLHERLRRQVAQHLLEIGGGDDVGEYHRQLSEVVLALETL